VVLVLERVGLIMHVLPLAGNCKTEQKVNSTPKTSKTLKTLANQRPRKIYLELRSVLFLDIMGIRQTRVEGETNS
jgi:hypothetical protein